MPGWRRSRRSSRAEGGIRDALPSCMTAQASVRSYQYVVLPYDRVRAALHNKGSSLIQTATRAASKRADDLASTLHVTAKGFDIGVGVDIRVDEAHDEQAVSLKSPVTRVKLGWKAVRGASLFPQLEGTLSAWPLSATETQIEIEGSYTPPLGVVGQALDNLLLHRIAEAAVHRFLEDVVEQLHQDVRAP